MPSTTTRHLGLFRVVLAATPALLALAEAVAEAQLIPAPSGGAAPTIVLSADHGVPGAAITVSGAVPGNVTTSAVRVHWLFLSATEPETEVAVDRARGYAVSLTVPPDATPGPAAVCAGLTDVALAELACASFTVDEPAPGLVEGRLPGPSAQPAAARVARVASALAVLNPYGATTLTLVDARGDTVATTTPSSSGAFLFTVPPGDYTLVQGGTGATAVAPVSVSVRTGTVSGVDVKAIAATMICGADQLPININNMEAAPTAPAANAHFGTYFSGVTLPVVFSLKPSDMFVRNPSVFFDPAPPEDQFDGIEYVFRDPQGHEVDRLRGNSFSDAVVFDVGRLPPGISTVTPYPVADGQLCIPSGDEFKRTIRVIANPAKIFARADSSITWEGGRSNDGVYRFHVIAPDIEFLPLSFPPEPITQVPGTSFRLPIVINNVFDAWTEAHADVKLNGETAFHRLGAGFQFTILNVEVLNETAKITPPGNIRVNFLEPRLSSFDINIPSLLPIRQEFTIYEGTVLDLFGLVQVIGALTAGFQGDVGLFSTIQPFVPNLSLRVIPEVAGIGSVSAGLGALNFVSGGARLNTRLGIAVPFLVRIDPLSVGPENPCGILQASAELFVRLSAGPVTLLRISSPSYPIILPAGIPLYFPPPFCSIGNAQVASIAAALDPQVPLALDDTLDGEPSPLPAVNPAPAVAVSSAGERLRVYVDDATAGSDTITPRLVSQTWNAASETWNAPVPITDGGHWVADPALAWVGSGTEEHARVAWTERPTTLAEDIALDDDIGALLSRQEIYSATFARGAWSVPERLTDDLVADGQASIAGDADGYTLAWTRDGDGNPATRFDMHVALLDAPSGEEPILVKFGGVPVGPPSDIPRPGPGGLQAAEPSVARKNGKPIVAFTVDRDGDALTDGDRGISVVQWTGSSWAFSGPEELPSAADSPSIAVTDDGRQWLAFLVRGFEDDGVSQIGSLSTRARVFTATRSSFNDAWQVSRTSNSGLDTDFLEDARGESPLMLTSGVQAQMVFRSFDLNSDGFGQLMLARVPGGGSLNRFAQITFGEKQRWFPSAAIDPASGDLVSVSLDVPGLTPAPDDYSLVTTELPGVADPAVVALEFDPPYANPGQVVTARATVQNLGLATTADDLTVDFLDGPPGTGTVFDSYSVTALPLLAFATAPVEITAAGGPQTIWARVRTAGGNADPTNDALAESARTLPAPLHVQVNPAGVAGALDVSWVGAEPPLPDEVAERPPPSIGYRIERSDLPGGTLELAGESTVPGFHDALLEVGQRYCYVVTAYDATGVVSPPSQEACADAPADPMNAGVPLIGSSLRLVESPAEPITRSLSISSRDPAVGFGLVPSTATDPVLHGATLRVGSAAGDSFDGVYDLPARNWEYKERDGVVDGYRYIDKDPSDSAAPVRSLVLDLGKSLRVSARGAALVTSLRADPAPVGMELRVGPQAYCLKFGGRTMHTPDRSFVARDAAAPETCPLLPAR